MAFYACLFTMDQQSAFRKLNSTASLVNHKFSFMHKILSSGRFLKCVSWYNMGCVSFVDAGRKNSGVLNITSFAAQRRRFHKFSSIFSSLFMAVFFHSWKVKFSKVRFFFHWNWCFSREEHSVGYRARKRFCRKKRWNTSYVHHALWRHLSYTVRPKYFSWNEKSGKRTYTCTGDSCPLLFEQDIFLSQSFRHFANIWLFKVPFTNCKSILFIISRTIWND